MLLRYILFVFLLVHSFSVFAVSEMESQNSERYFLPETVRMFSKFMLHAQNKSNAEKIFIYNQAIQQLKLWVDLPVSTKEISSLEEYIKVKYASRESYSVLDLEIKHLLNNKAFYKFDFQFNDENAKQDVHNYHKNQLEFVRKFLLEKLVSDTKLKEGHKSQLNTLNENYAEIFLQELLKLELLNSNEAKQSTIQKLQFANLLPNETKLAIVNQFEMAFHRIEKELRNIGNKVSADSSKFDIQMSQLKGIGRFIQLLLGGVFNNLTDVGAKNMISGLIDNPDQRSDLESFKTVLGYGVPQLLKLLQLVARMEGMDPNIQEAFKSLESSGRSAPLALVEEMLELEKENMLKQGIRIIKINRAFHAGTIAQIHFVTIEITNQDGNKEIKEVVLRAIKPGMEEKIEQGRWNMTKTAQTIDNDAELKQVNWPKLGPSVEGLSNNIKDDIDTVGASQRQIRGKEVYTHRITKKVNNQNVTIDFIVPEIFYYSDPKDNGVRIMLMEKVKGEKIEDLRTENSELAKAISKGLMHKWMEAGFIEPGFIHADLHFGNFMAEIIKNTSSEANLAFKQKDNELYVRVPIIDFGMGGEVEQKYRKAFVTLLLASKLKDPVGIRNILWGLSKSSNISQVEFNYNFAKRYKENMEAPADQKMASKDWVIFAIDQGLVMPEPFISLSRGTGIMLILAVRYELAKVLTGMIKSTIKEKPMIMLKSIRESLIDYSYINSLIRRKAAKKSYQIKKKIRNSCSGAFGQ